MDLDKKKIVERFKKKVKGKKPDTSRYHKNHDGSGGHWLQKQMGVKNDSKNAPDLFGYEMKNHTGSKTTFGDWSPNRKLRIYSKGNKYGLDRSTFLKIFGAPNPLKKNRYSWSGKPVPKVGSYNAFGQKLSVDKDGNISALYSYSKDQRASKAKIVPKNLQKNNLVLATWDVEMMRKRVENKFNHRGWFKCERDERGAYRNIVFGEPMTFETWIKGVRNGLIIFDSGMYEGNKRPYANWRADNGYWRNLIIERY